MAIIGQETINIGAENQATDSDSLYQAFNKIQNNFTTLFSTGSPYNSYIGNAGISTYSNASSGEVFITNTGVLSLTAGTGIVISNTTGNIIISSTGSSGNGSGSVTNVNIVSSTLSVAGSPIVSSGNIIVDLPLIPVGPSFAAGNYTAPSITVDNYGRITEIANTTGVGTVTSVALTAVGDGLSVTGSPITNSGAIEITNTGVTKLRAGTGIDLSGESGEVTISSLNINQGTVTRIDVTSNALVITGSPVTTTGNITIDLPGNVLTNNITANTTLSSLGNLVVVGNANVGNIGAVEGVFTGNITGNLNGAHNGTIGATTPNTGAFTNITVSSNANVTGNIRGSYVTASQEVIGNQLTVKNGGAIVMTNTANRYVALFTPPTIAANLVMIMPNTDGYPYSVLSTNGQANTVGYATLGWKTVVTQYVSVLLRNGVSTILVPPTPAKRTEPILTRDGTTYAAVTLY